MGPPAIACGSVLWRAGENPRQRRVPARRRARRLGWKWRTKTYLRSMLKNVEPQSQDEKMTLRTAGHSISRNFCIQSGCSITAVRMHGVHVARVRFPAARQITIKVRFSRHCSSEASLQWRGSRTLSIPKKTQNIKIAAGSRQL